MPDTPRVNNNQYGWGSLETEVAGQRLFGYTEISFKDTRNRSYTYGQNRSQKPRGRTSGKYDPGQVTLTGYASSISAFLKALANLSGTSSFGNAPFEIIINAVEDGEETPMTVLIEDCRVTSVGESWSEGEDALMQDLEIQPMCIRRNGLVLFDDRDF